MRLALDDAHVTPDEIATSTRTAARRRSTIPTETLAIKQTFGDHAPKLPMSGTKGYYGHALGASGAIETAICALALERNGCRRR